MKQKKEQKKKIEKVEKQLRTAKIIAPTSAAAQVARFLVKTFPKIRCELPLEWSPHRMARACAVGWAALKKKWQAPAHPAEAVA